MKKIVTLIVILAISKRILAPKKVKDAGLTHRESICRGNHEELTEQGLCEHCGIPLGW